MDPLQRAPINQPVPLVDYDVAAADQALLDSVDAFCASRFAGDWAGTFGTLPRALHLAGIVARTTRHLD